MKCMHCGGWRSELPDRRCLSCGLDVAGAREKMAARGRRILARDPSPRRLDAWERAQVEEAKRAASEPRADESSPHEAAPTNRTAPGAHETAPHDDTTDDERRNHHERAEDGFRDSQGPRGRGG